MPELQSKLNNIISDIEKNLKNKDDLEFVKTQIYNIYTMFMDEFDQLEEKNNKKLESILIKYKTLEDRMQKMEHSIDKIESDIYIDEDDNEEFLFDITCPYCDEEFSVDCSNELKDSVVCPECNNTIELDWNEHEGCCSHDCCGCGAECEHDHNEEDEDM